jgi:hypothetical protein
VTDRAICAKPSSSDPPVYSLDDEYSAEVRRVVASKSFEKLYDSKTSCSTVTEESERSSAESYDHPASSCIEADVIGISSQIGRLEEFIVAPIEHLDRAALSCSGEAMIGCRVEVQPLRFRNVRDGLDSFAVRNVQHFDGSISECRHKQTVALQVSAEVIDSALDVRKSNPRSHG